MMKSNVRRGAGAVGLVALALTVALAMFAVAGELRGVVLSVAGEVVTVRCQGVGSPRPGDSVRIGFEAPGVGFVALEGSWKVSLVGPGGEVQARPATDPHGEPQPGYVVLITSTGASTRPPGGETPGGVETPPGGNAVPGPDRAGLPPVARKPWLGLLYAPTKPGTNAGVTIVDVFPDGPSARAGVRKGDVILAMDAMPIPNVAALEKGRDRLRPGVNVSLRLLRLPNVIELSVRPELPPLDSPAVQTEIGYAFLTGRDIGRDERKALEWLQHAAAGGDQDAVKILARYRKWKEQADRGGSAGGVSRGVFVAGSEGGNRPGWFVVEAGIHKVLSGNGVRVRDLPQDLWSRRNALSSPDEAFRSIRQIGGGWLLWVQVRTKWTAFGFGKDRVTVQCYDPAGQLVWEKTASNVMASSADRSLQLVTQKIIRKLIKMRGKPCLQ